MQRQSDTAHSPLQARTHLPSRSGPQMFLAPDSGHVQSHCLLPSIRGSVCWELPWVTSGDYVTWLGGFLPRLHSWGSSSLSFTPWVKGSCGCRKQNESRHVLSPRVPLVSSKAVKVPEPGGLSLSRSLMLNLCLQPRQEGSMLQGHRGHWASSPGVPGSLLDTPGLRPTPGSLTQIWILTRAPGGSDAY